MALFQDDFTGVAGQAIEARAGWTLHGVTGVLTLNAANQLQATSSTRVAASHDTGNIEHYGQCEWLDGGASLLFLAARVVDENNLIAVRINGSSVQVYKRVGGNYSLQTPSGTDSAPNGKPYRISVNAAHLVTVNDGTTDIVSMTVNDAALNAATRAGIHNFTAGNPIADNFEADVLGGSASAALSGTLTVATDESDITSGGHVADWTLTGETWVAAGASFDAIRQPLIDTLVSAQSEATGWNAQRVNIPVTAVTRVSDTVARLTLPALAGYDITAQETITPGDIPAAAVTGGVAVPVSGSFTIDTVVGNSITLTEIDNNRVIQRDASTGNADVPVVATWTGSPTAIRAKVIDAVTLADVVAWTVVDAAPSGGAVNATITVPARVGQHRLVVDFANDAAATDTGVNAWSVGMSIAMPGDSIARNMFTLLPQNDLVASAGTYVHDLTDDQWHPLTGYSDGAITMANALVAHFNVAIGLYFEGIGAKKLDEWAINTPGGIYDDMVAAVGASDIEAVVAIVGINDAGTPETAASHAANWATFVSNLRTDFANASTAANLPVFASLPGGSGASTDANVEAVRAGTRDAVAAGTDLYLGVHMPDIPTDGGGTHPIAADMQTVGERAALSIIDVLGSGTYHRGPQVTSVVAVSATQTRINVAHAGGTDITPASGITGIDILDDGVPVTVSASVRESATSILLTHTAITGQRSARGLFGAAPAISAPARDNTSEQLPIEWFAEQAVAIGVTIPVENRAGAAQASLSGLRYSVFETADVSALADANKLASGTGESTDGSGDLVIDLSSTGVAAGAAVTVLLQDGASAAPLGVAPATVAEL